MRKLIMNFTTRMIRPPSVSLSTTRRRRRKLKAMLWTKTKMEEVGIEAQDEREDVDKPPPS